MFPEKKVPKKSRGASRCAPTPMVSTWANLIVYFLEAEGAEVLPEAGEER